MQTCESGRVPNIMSECYLIHNYYIKAKSSARQSRRRPCANAGSSFYAALLHCQTISSGTRDHSIKPGKGNMAQVHIDIPLKNCWEIYLLRTAGEFKANFRQEILLPN